ncbi:bifunctional metallophosphatase/5'-nucleotidase [Aeromonas hydrophila]|uniref:Bifunctional metallophosphatase/5'-nucleotidase n=1 Tax=Aeromonas hydrophila TaxID=644 RepID=A0ABD7G2Q9_AERHY|nr:bifunctional metallophosphatase/5'-nucleotidase [Aeromonas hydrophila]MBC8669780.1 bifunctional metallophosphatase/5'-nucleotidase [Aeromonas hydrophila]MBC8687569.1 bifunctional metallophosphatase/5'-nucleotidase [Aeromonas hydrophila]RCF44797.1 bifunctional metallophosphatase/5'-nucleotidase [Aeromonas hydrophila]
MNRLRPLLLLAFCSFLFACQPGNEGQPFVLTLAHMNDTHSQFDPVNAELKGPIFGKQGETNTLYTRFGGYPRLLTMAKSFQADALAKNQPILLLHGGDAWQGSGYFKLNEGMANAELLSQFGLDAMALGNHEFDLDNQKLARFIQGVNFPVLAANLDTRDDPDLRHATNLKPFVIYAFDGNQKSPVSDLNNLPQGKQLVAVMGLVLEDMANISPNVGKLRFGNEITSAQATVDLLRQHGINQIVALTHIGNQRDLALAAKVNGIDAIVGGHSHSLLGDFRNIGWGNTGEYAALVTNPDGVGMTCVVQAGSYAQAIGLAQVSFDAQGRVIACKGQNQLLASRDFFADPARKQALDEARGKQAAKFIDAQPNLVTVDEDPRLRGIIDSHYKPALEQAFGPVIATLPAALQNARRPGDNGSDSHGSDVAPLVAEGQYYWANTPAVQALTGGPVHFALLAVGGVRADLPAGELREGDAALTLLPFKNQLSVLTLTGADVRALLTETITATLPASAHAGKFPYGGHLRYTFTETTPGKRGALTQLQWQDADGQWQDLVDATHYRVVMNAYSANGNDGWQALARVQAQHAERQDLAWQDGKLTAFPVERVEQSGDQLSARYTAGHQLDCKASGMDCGTDAASFVQYVREQRPTLTALAEETVTLVRAAQ